MGENRLWKASTLGFVACAMLVDCGGGSSSSSDPGVSVTVPPAPKVFLKVGGNVSGLSGTVVLQNNGADALTMSADGAFTFPTRIPANAGYAVTVLTQPAGQNCTVANGSGNLTGDPFLSIPPSDVTNVKITCAPYGATTLALFAGNMGGPGAVDGTTAAAQFFIPQGVVADKAGNIYLADSGNRTIRKVDPTGAVSTLAGVPRLYGTADGLGAAARFTNPVGMAIDAAGNLYVADSNPITLSVVGSTVSNGNVRKVTPAGVVTTLAELSGTTPGPLFGIAVDSRNNVYVADSANCVIREVTPAGRLLVFAGAVGSCGSADGTGTGARFDWPYALAIDAMDNVYVADAVNRTIRKITPAGVVSTLAGTPGNFGTFDGIGPLAQFTNPVGIGVDSLGNVYVTDWQDSTPGYAVRKITPTGSVSTLALVPRGVITDEWPIPALFFGIDYPMGVTVDAAGNVYVADATSSVIRKITPQGAMSVAAGIMLAPGSTDGTGSAAQFQGPERIAADSLGNLYVADGGNATIRKITPAGVVSTFAGTAGVTGSADGTGSAAQFSFPWSVATDAAGNVYVADLGNRTIRKITPAGVVSTLAGTAGTNGTADGTGPAAQFKYPNGVATDNAGNVYVADTDACTVRKITPAGVVSTFAGTAGSCGSVVDGVGAAARFASPWDVAVDSAGNVYVSDQSIRVITPAGVVSTLPGSMNSNVSRAGIVDGPLGTATFGFAQALTVDSAGNVYLADWGNSIVRKISTGGVVSTVAGVLGQSGFQPGSAPGVIAFPTGVAVSGSSLYIVTANGVAVLQ